jgi:hypothetical protein
MAAIELLGYLHDHGINYLAAARNLALRLQTPWVETRGYAPAPIAADSSRHTHTMNSCPGTGDLVGRGLGV